MGSASPGARFAAAVRRRGAPILLTNVTRTSGPAPLVNPPDLNMDNLVVAGGYTAGSATIGLATTLARGVLLPGDQLFFGQGGGQGSTTVTAAAPSSASTVAGFAAVPISPFPLDMLDGTPVSILYQADIGTWGIVNSFPLRLVDGTRIQSQDLSVTIGADGVPMPLDTWRLTFSGRSYSIENIQQVYERGCLISYQLQAR